MREAPSNADMESMGNQSSAIDGELSPWRVAGAVLRNRPWFVLCPLVGAFILVASALLVQRTYSTTLLFSSETAASPMAGLQNIAAQFGVNVGGAGDVLQSPDFYVMLVGSDGFLRKVASTTFSAHLNGELVSGDYAVVNGIRKADSAATLDAAVRALRRQVSAHVDSRSQLVQVAIKANDSALAVQIGRRILELVDTFNINTRQSQAGAQYVFVSARLTEAEQELEQAEQAMLTFLKRNRDFRNSPELSFENGRLQRDVDRRQGIVDQLSQSREAARIEQVRNTPITSVVQGPIPPLRADSRRLPVKCVLGLALGIVIATLVAFVRESVHGNSSDPATEVAEVRRLLGVIRGEVRHPFQTVLSWVRGHGA